jgi:hypothetical protein
VSSTFEEVVEKDPEKYMEQRQNHINALVRLWCSSLQGHAVPTEVNFIGWLDSFGWNIMRQAIPKTANKARREERNGCPMNLSGLEAYTTGTARALAREAGFWKK